MMMYVCVWFMNKICVCVWEREKERERERERERDVCNGMVTKCYNLAFDMKPHS